MNILDRDVNPNVVTHELNLPGLGRTMVADHLREGYGDELSFGNLTQDAIGDLTGNNKLAIMAGENARETWDTRNDLIMADLARKQAKRKAEPVCEIFSHTNGQDTIMVTCQWVPELEKQLVGVAHCWETADGGWDHKIIHTRVL